MWPYTALWTDIYRYEINNFVISQNNFVDKLVNDTARSTHSILDRASFSVQYISMYCTHYIVQCTNQYVVLHELYNEYCTVHNSVYSTAYTVHKISVYLFICNGLVLGLFEENYNRIKYRQMMN